MLRKEMSMVRQIAIAVVEHHGHFLVGTREQGTTLAGFAEFPGGKIEANESGEEAALRECREETDLEVDVVRLLHRTEFDYPHARLHISFFLCSPRTNANIVNVPLKGSFRWVAKNELSKLKFPPANDELLGILLSCSDAIE